MASIHTRQVLNFTYVKLHRTKVELSVAGFTSIVEVFATYIGGCMGRFYARTLTHKTVKRTTDIPQGRILCMNLDQNHYM